MAAENTKISSLGAQAVKLARDCILMHFRFFDRALAQLPPREAPGIACMAADGSSCCYDPVFVLKCYRDNPGLIPRIYLHMLLHCVFFHSFQCDRLERDKWDLAADIAVENVILDLSSAGTALEQDDEARAKLRVLKEDIGVLTAERIYRYLRQAVLTSGQLQELRLLFARDDHAMWQPEKPGEAWRKVSERMKTELKVFAERKKGAEALEKNLEEVTRERCRYDEILRKFAVTGEDMAVNDEEFDYIYYTYGLEHYGNLPLIEPLEYREVKKVKEFVIVLDTSASCRGEIVREFVRKTYSILKEEESFFHRVNIHIIQCDNQVRSDTRITCQEDFELFMKNGRLSGFGGTDFTPVFDYVDELRKKKEFENLQGMIYFTDGYGIYPGRMPEYRVIFAFLEEDENRAPVPPWSSQVILEREELERGAGERGTEERGTGEKGAGESRTEKRETGEKGAGESGTEEREIGESGAEEKGTEEKGAGENGAGKSGRERRGTE